MITKLKLSIFALLLLILEQPFIYQLRPADILKAPHYIVSQIKGEVSEDSLKEIKDMRWASRDNHQQTIGLIFYNKGILFVKESFNALGNLSLKRLFFGGFLLWPLLIPFIGGLIETLKSRSPLILLLLLSTLITVITGQPTATFLFPTIILILIIANNQLKKLDNKKFIAFHLFSWFIIFLTHVLKI